MPKPFKLEVFVSSSNEFGPQNDLVNSADLEEARLAAYEQGYSAGWDDSLASYAADKDRVSTEFAKNLNELSFTYHEVRSTVLKSLEPIFRDMVTKILPTIARESLGYLIADEVSEMARTHSDVPVEIVVAPPNKDLVQKLSEQIDCLPLKICEESSLGDGQAFIRIGQVEKQVDLDGVLQGFSSALDGFFEQSGEEQAHG